MTLRLAALVASIVVSIVVTVACGSEAQQQLVDARREFRDVEKALGKARREMGDVTNELADAAEASGKDFGRDVQEIARAAKEASEHASLPGANPSEPALEPADRIHCEGQSCVVERSLLDELRGHPARLLKEGLVVPHAGPPAGLRLEQLRSGGLAEQLGLRNGDVLTAINDRPITSLEDLMRLPGNSKPRPEVTVTLRRGDEEIRLAVRLAAPVEAPGEDADPGSRQR